MSALLRHQNFSLGLKYLCYKSLRYNIVLLTRLILLIRLRVTNKNWIIHIVIWQSFRSRSCHLKRSLVAKKWSYFCSPFTCTWLKVNESRYKQRGVTPHFSIGQNLLKKRLRKDKYWHNQLREAFWSIHWP